MRTPWVQVVGRGIRKTVMEVLPLVGWVVIGSATFWVLLRAGMTPVIGAELSLAVALLVVAHARERWSQAPVPARTWRERRVLPALCLALAAGSHTAVWRLGIAPDQVVEWTAQVIGGCVLVFFLLGLFVILVVETLLIYAGVRPLGTRRPMDVVVTGMFLMGVGSVVLVDRVFTPVGMGDHLIARIVLGLLLLASVVLPVWRTVHLLKHPRKSV